MCGLMRGNPGWLQNDSFVPADENVFVFPFPCYLFPSSSHLPGRQLMLTNPQYCRYEQLTRTHGPEQAAKMRQEKHAVVPAAGPTSEPAEAATEPQRTATAVRARQYTAPAGDKVSDERQRLQQLIDRTCAEGAEKLKATNVSNPHVLDTLAVRGLRALQRDLEAALAQALEMGKAQRDVPAALTMAPNAWGGNGLRPQQPACLPGGRRGRTPRSSKPKGAPAAGSSDGAGRAGAEPEAAALIKVFKETTKRKTQETRDLADIAGRKVKHARKAGAGAAGMVPCDSTTIFPPELTDAQRKTVHNIAEANGKFSVTVTDPISRERRLFLGGDGSGREDIGKVVRLAHRTGQKVTKAQLDHWLNPKRHAAPPPSGLPAGPAE